MELLAVILDTVGYKHWLMKGYGYEVKDRIIIFHEGKAEFRQVVFAKKPFVKFSFYDRCEESRLRVQIHSRDLKHTIYSKDNTSWNDTLLKLDVEDTVIFSVSFSSSAKTFCKLYFKIDETNFIKNYRFDEMKVFPKGWAFKSANYEGGKVFINDGYIRKEIHLERGTVFRLSLRGRGDFVIYLKYGNLRKKFSGNILMDTVPATYDTLSIKIKCERCYLESVKLDKLKRLKVVITKLRRKLFVYSYSDGLRIYIYDSNGRIYMRKNLKRGLNELTFNRGGKFLVVVPKLLKRIVHVR